MGAVAGYSPPPATGPAPPRVCVLVGGSRGPSLSAALPGVRANSDPLTAVHLPASLFKKSFFT